jgi:superfamily I DNA and/or RNA helicase
VIHVSLPTSFCFVLFFSSDSVFGHVSLLFRFALTFSFVGQLPATIFSRIAKDCNYSQSLFLRLQKAGHAVTMLETQYRMHPLIASYPSQRFYSNRLITAASVLTSTSHHKPYHSDSSGRFKPFLFHDLLYSNEEIDSISIRNRDEARYVLYLYDELIHRYPEYRGNVGIIAPYRAQRRYLTSLFRSNYGNHASGGVKKDGGGGGGGGGSNDVMNDVEISTIDGFQGREKDIIIFSCVRSHPRGTSGASAIGFLKEWQRLNVAITRAKYALWIVGNSQTLTKDVEWNELIQYMRKQKAAIAFSSEKATRFPSVGSSSTSSTSNHNSQSKQHNPGSSSSSSKKHQPGRHQHRARSRSRSPQRHQHGSKKSGGSSHNSGRNNSSSNRSRSGSGGLRN